MHERCMSVKNRKSSIQCPYKRKTASDYCGIHGRCKNVIRAQSVKPQSVYHPQSVHIKEIITIQRAIRVWCVYRRSRCVNPLDFCTCIPLIKIPYNLFFTYRDQNQFWYGFDVRSFSGLLDNHHTNPYTRDSISMKVIASFRVRCSQLEKVGISTHFASPTLTVKQKMLDKMLRTFQKIDLLDNYTDYRWFRKLNKSKLRRLYADMQDIWQNRCHMNMLQRQRMVKNGIIFEKDRKFMRNKSLSALRTIILNEFDRMVSEGINEAERKLGAMLILTSLVKVSPEAAMTLPNFVQY